tara:strand:+ start:356 stop:541 length:186 start_codon:yes stop_codon:yes gene_type:complete
MSSADWRLGENGTRTLHVSGDWTALTLGEASVRLTSAVVQSVFMVIMFDAIFAVIFMMLDL